MTKAVIFDMNGVIIVDEDFHNQSWQTFCDRHGFSLSADEFSNQVMGKRDKDTLNYLFKKELTDEELNKYADERDEIVEVLVKGRLELPERLLELLQKIKSNGIPMAIATSSRKGYVEFIMKNFNLRHFFPVIVTAEDIANGKPDPEIYLKTAEILNVLPEDCLAIEDSKSGIKSAKSAGMKVIGYTSSLKEDELTMLADEVIDSFKELDIPLPISS